MIKHKNMIKFTIIVILCIVCYGNSFSMIKKYFLNKHILSCNNNFYDDFEDNGEVPFFENNLKVPFFEHNLKVPFFEHNLKVPFFEENKNMLKTETLNKKKHTQKKDKFHHMSKKEKHKFYHKSKKEKNKFYHKSEFSTHSINEDNLKRILINIENEKYNISQTQSKHFKVIKNTNITFDNVGGYDFVKNELKKKINIIKNYEKYSEYDVNTQFGIAFVGEPGIGKTLMAKAFCGEVNASIIIAPGSEFIETGSQKIIELFNLARQNRPCVIFIDNVDSIGRKRKTVNSENSSDNEKESTLNQLLFEIDRFNTDSDHRGVFVVCATNREDLLDPALITAGRIETTICMNKPDEITREQISEIYIEKKQKESDVNSKNIAKITEGFTGAQIKKILNDAMIDGIESGICKLTNKNIELMISREYNGIQSIKYSTQTKKIIAIHELSHAIVGLILKDHMNPKLITFSEHYSKILALVIFEEKKEDTNIFSRSEFIAILSTLLAGHIGEKEFFGNDKMTSGATEDLNKIKTLSLDMVLKMGMGSNRINYGLSEDNKKHIEKQAQLLVDEAENKTQFIIKTYKNVIEDLSKQLITEEKLELIDLQKKILNEHGQIIKL